MPQGILRPVPLFAPLFIFEGERLTLRPLENTCGFTVDVAVIAMVFDRDGPNSEAPLPRIRNARFSPFDWPTLST